MTVTKIICGVAALSLLAACTTIDPQTGQQRRNNTGTGAIIGAASGAILGKATGSHHRDRALVGAAVGALAGAAVGQYMDRQEAAMRQQMAGTGVTVTRDGDRLILNMPSEITFAVNRADIQSQFNDVLDKVARVVNEYPKTMIEVSGHTDSTGSAAYNQTLSENRANSVASYLMQRGVMAQRVHAIGYGESKPIATNSTTAGRAKNRRVELALIPLVQN